MRLGDTPGRGSRPARTASIGVEFGLASGTQVPVYRRVMTSPDMETWAPESCTLPLAERPLRRAEFTALFAASLRGLQRVDRTRLRMTLASDTDTSTVIDLTTREAECCSFFSFTVLPVDGAVGLDVSVPPAYVDVLEGLARHAASAAGLSA